MFGRLHEMIDFARKSLSPKGISGIDSIQGILELALWYEGGGIKLNFSAVEKNYSHSQLNAIRRLEKEGYIIVQYSERVDNFLQLESIALTVSGHKLLNELQDKSSSGKLKKRITDLLWIIITTIITTLVVLWIKGD